MFRDPCYKRHSEQIEGDDHVFHPGAKVNAETLGPLCFVLVVTGLSLFRVILNKQLHQNPLWIMHL